MAAQGLRLTVSADVSSLTSELQGKGTAAVQGFTASTDQSFKELTKSIHLVTPAAEEMRQSTTRADRKSVV